MEDEVPRPLVDLLCLESNVNDVKLRDVGKQIVDAFQSTGYTYLKIPNFTAEDIENFVEATNTFFDLEEEIKLKYKKKYETLHGYATELEETIDESVSDKSKALRNSFDIQGLDEIFPDEEVPEMRFTAENILNKLLPMVLNVLRSLEFELGMKCNTLIDGHKLMGNTGSLTDLKIMRYMPPEGEEQIHRLEAHFDYATLTFQLYGDLEGLEFLDNEKVWQKLKLYPGYILLFPSETIQMWTGDKLKALMHRVVIPEDEVTRRKPRHAVILFLHPDNEFVIKPMGDGPKKYEPIAGRDFAQKRMKIFYQRLQSY